MNRKLKLFYIFYTFLILLLLIVPIERFGDIGKFNVYNRAHKARIKIFLYSKDCHLKNNFLLSKNGLRNSSFLGLSNEKINDFYMDNYIKWWIFYNKSFLLKEEAIIVAYEYQILKMDNEINFSSKKKFLDTNNYKKLCL